MKNTPEGFQPKARSLNIVVQEAAQELLLYDLNTNRAFCLNEKAAKIYNHCDGNKSVKTIGRLLDIDSDYVLFAVAQLSKENLLDNKNQTFKTNHQSRRELFQKAALNSAVALPLLTSIIAPRATNAASVSTPGCGIQNPPSGAPCPPIDCFSACNGGGFTIVIINGCRACNCVC